MFFVGVARAGTLPAVRKAASRVPAATRARMVSNNIVALCWWRLQSLRRQVPLIGLRLLENASISDLNFRLELNAWIDWFFMAALPRARVISRCCTWHLRG